MNNVAIGTDFVILTARAHAFTGYGLGTYSFLVKKRVVLVYDSVAGHYTSCHALSKRTQSRIRRLATIVGGA